MKTVNPNIPYDYIPEGDRSLPEGERSIVKCTYLTTEETALIQNARNLGPVTALALDLGLAELANTTKPDGSPLVLQRDEQAAVIIGKKKPWKRELLDMIHQKERDEIAAVIIRGGEQTRAEAKNS